MRLSLQKNTGSWRLAEMHEVHLDFLRRAADDASMRDCPGGRERLYPKPLDGKEELLDGEFNDEWKDLVAAELEIQFAGDVGVFLADLDSVQRGRKLPGGGAALYRIDVPLAHGPAWFSTLNQARLLLDLKHKLHEPRDFPPDDDADESPAAARPLLLLRYEFYAWIQEWLVRNVF